VFDCSGFARLVLGKHYQQEWVSYQEYLPLTHTIAFPTPHDGSQNILKPATEAIAMPHGWMWRVPIQSRYGNGYVYDGSMITEEQAVSEIESYHKIKLGHHMKFKYDPGSFRKTLHKNSLAVGIAQSFVEPMEATSIWVGFINVIRCLRQGGMEIRDQSYQDHFNEICYDTNWSVMELLYMHYLGQRTDTEFWRTFKTRTNYKEAMSRIGHTLELWEQATPIDNTFTDRTDLINVINWMQLGQGLRMFNDKHRAAFKRRLDRITGGSQGVDLEEPVARFQSNQNYWVDQSLEHRRFLDHLKSR
jgi:tryptophan halogenase